VDEKIIKAITLKVSRRFPEVSDVKPKVKKYLPPGEQQRAYSKKFLLLYKTRVAGPGGHTLPRVVRVVSTPEGKILKMSTSK
jgi:hypothetical protein